MEAFLQQKQAEQDKQLKQQEMEFRRELTLNWTSKDKKKQELMNKYQSEKQQLQNKVQMTDHVTSTCLDHGLLLIRIVKQFCFEILLIFEKPLPRSVCYNQMQRVILLCDKKKTCYKISQLMCQSQQVS